MTIHNSNMLAKSYLDQREAAKENSQQTREKNEPS